VHTYLAMKMHIAIFGVGLAFLSFSPTTRLFDRGGHSDGEVREMHGEGGGTDGHIGERLLPPKEQRGDPTVVKQKRRGRSWEDELAKFKT